MFEPKRYIKINGKLTQLGYDKYTQNANQHQEDNMIALNNRFPNLVAYGFLQYLKELMALRPDCKLEYSKDNIRKIAAMVNMDYNLVNEIFDFCLNELKIFKKLHTWRELERSEEWYICYPDFMAQLIEIQTKRIGEEAEVRRNASKRDHLKPFQSISAKKKQMIAEMKEFLKLTPEIKKEVKRFYPDVNISEMWDDFIEMIETSYLEWHALLSPENYATNFYTFLNKNTLKNIEIPSE